MSQLPSLAPTSFKWDESWSGGDVERVQVSGDWDDWKGRTELLKQPDGSFTHTFDLPADTTVSYKFILNGDAWVTSSKDQTRDDGRGNTNNTRQTGAAPAPPPVSAITGATPLPGAVVPGPTKAEIKQKEQKQQEQEQEQQKKEEEAAAAAPTSSIGAAASAAAGAIGALFGAGAATAAAKTTGDDEKAKEAQAQADQASQKATEAQFHASDAAKSANENIVAPAVSKTNEATSQAQASAQPHVDAAAEKTSSAAATVQTKASETADAVASHPVVQQARENAVAATEAVKQKANELSESIPQEHKDTAAKTVTGIAGAAVATLGAAIGTVVGFDAIRPAPQPVAEESETKAEAGKSGTATAPAAAESESASTPAAAPAPAAAASNSTSNDAESHDPLKVSKAAEITAPKPTTADSLRPAPSAGAAAATTSSSSDSKEGSAAAAGAAATTTPSSSESKKESTSAAGASAAESHDPLKVSKAAEITAPKPTTADSLHPVPGAAATTTSSSSESTKESTAAAGAAAKTTSPSSESKEESTAAAGASAAESHDPLKVSKAADITAPKPTKPDSLAPIPGSAPVGSENGSSKPAPEPPVTPTKRVSSVATSKEKDTTPTPNKRNSLFGTLGRSSKAHARSASVAGGSGEGAANGESTPSGTASNTASPQIGSSSEYGTAPSSPDSNNLAAGSQRHRKKSLFGKIKNAFASPNSSPSKTASK